MKKFLIGLLLCIIAAAPASAQSAPPTPLPSSILCNTCYAGLSVTATTGNVALPSPNPALSTVTIVNTGTKDAYIALGGSGVTAAVSNIPVRTGKHITFWTSAAYIAAITGGSDTTTLDIYQSNGPLYFGP